MEPSVSEPSAPPYKGPLFEPITRQSASLRISTVIEQKILRRSLRPGDSLPTETELAEQFAVHRSTVREALRRLESVGLVGREGGSKKLRVTRPDHAETASRVGRTLALDDVTFIELWEAMRAVAPRTAALAAENSAPESVATLDAIVNAVETARGADAAVGWVVDFFGKLAEMSGNRVLMLAMQPVTKLLAPSLRRMIDRVPQGRTRILVAQRCIVEAIRLRQPDEAEGWMTRHVQDFRRGYELAGIALDTKVGTSSITD
jgi:GntR family transcriptional regulator, transcriptional repressor for pyruvate dehydrogenase complex